MEQPKPLISIIILVYNVADYLVPCLESVCAQTYENLEIVVVNDGSTDQSPEILRRFAEQDGRIVVLDKENAGLITARRDGVKISTGEYIFWVDGDDYVSLDCIEKLYEAAVRSGSDIASAQRVRVCTDYISSDGFIEPGVRTNREFLSILLLHRHVTVGGKLYRKNLWENLSYYEEINLGEDFILNLELALDTAAPSIVFVGDAFYFYVQRPGSMIRCRDKFAYLEKFMGRVAEVTSKYIPYGDGLDAEITAERAMRMYVYIKKSHNEWKGDAPLYLDVRDEVLRAEKELKGLLPSSVIRCVKLYRHRGNRVFINLSSAVRRWKQSVRRRHLGFDPLKVPLPPSAKLPRHIEFKKTGEAI